MRSPALRPHRHDVWIAVAGLLGGLVDIVYGLYSVFSTHGHGPLALVGLLLMCGAELLRRTAPSWALAAAVVALAADIVTGGMLAVVIMFSDVVYASVLYGSPRLSRVVPPLGTGTSVAVTVVAVAVTRQPEALLLGVLSTVCFAMPTWTAVIMRDHRETAAAERLRAEQTALLAEMDRAQAVNAERARMARELHDVVANHLSAIAVHSTAALSLSGPETTRNALTVIRENSTQGLAEMRRLIGLLRRAASDQEPEAAPSLEGVDALLDQAARNGAASRLRFTGHDDRDGRPRPPAPVELAAYRIVQESLTNAVKHAAPGEVAVALDQHGEALVVTVTSPYDERSAARAPGAGAGLTGMRERVELLQGAFTAGLAPGPGGAPIWRVRAELPVTQPTGRTERTSRT